MKLILASSSPRRAEILRDAGVAFEVCSTLVEEARLPGESAMAMVARLADAKARAAIASIVSRADSSIVVGADTVVELEGQIFGKPRDAREAGNMLAALSGRTHRVLTGICLIRLPEGASRRAVEISEVSFATLDAREIREYVESGEPFDKAGGYAIQGRGGRYIPRIEGCYFNVVGMPLARLYMLLRELGWPGPR